MVLHILLLCMRLDEKHIAKFLGKEKCGRLEQLLVVLTVIKYIGNFSIFFSGLAVGYEWCRRNVCLIKKCLCDLSIF